VSPLRHAPDVAIATLAQNVGMQLNFIANASVPSSSGKTLPVIDPSDGQVFDHLQRSNAQDIDDAVRAARQCYDTVWGKLSAAERGRLLMRLSVKVGEHADELAALEQRDCGKPTKQARADALARFGTSSSTPVRPTSSTAKPFPTRTATACSPGAKPMA